MSFPVSIDYFKMGEFDLNELNYYKKQEIAKKKREERQNRFRELTKDLSKEDLEILKFGFRGML